MTGEPLSVVVASRALDGLTMRMAALASSMANINTSQYRPIDVNFESALRAASAQGPDAVERLEFRFSAGPVFDEHDDRRIDLLIADASRTAGRFAAVADLLGRRMALHEAAVGGQR